MATSQQEQATMVGIVREEDKAYFEEMKKQADCNSIVSANTKEKVRTAAVVGNLTKSAVGLIHLHEWSGFWESGGPDAIIQVRENTKFVQIGTLPAGGKAGFKYATSTHQWIVAFHVPLRDDGENVKNRVYFEDGPVREVDWDVIEKKLDGEVIPLPSPFPSAGFAFISQGSDARLVAAFTEPKHN